MHLAIYVFYTPELLTCPSNSWYLLIDIDRWMRWNRNSVPFGYIVLAPISETFRVSSTILLLSGTFRVVWREVGQGERKGWRAAAKIISFFSVLPALFYIILFVALAVCWLKFTSLNTIADIATRKAQFQIAMSAIFFGYAMVSVVAATVTWCFRTRSMRGYVIQVSGLLSTYGVSSMAPADIAQPRAALSSSWRRYFFPLAVVLNSSCPCLSGSIRAALARVFSSYLIACTAYSPSLSSSAT